MAGMARCIIFWENLSILTKNVTTRRQFVAGASGLLLAGAAEGADQGAAKPPQRSALALHGGEKAVKTAAGSGRRWRERELKQLEAMLRQDSLFYWQGSQRGPSSRRAFA